MSTAPKETTGPFELKGEMSLLSVLRLLDVEPRRIASALAAKVKQSPALFRNVPVVIDLGALPQDGAAPDFPHLVTTLREHGLIPVGVRHGPRAMQDLAEMAGLAILPASSPRRMPRQEQERSGKAEEPSAARSQRHSQLVDKPVRSGQQIYAADGDLVLVAPASPGSELLAAGCIHVYGALRGRALAGVNGDTLARIFCFSLEAELVAIAGRYQLIEDIDPELRNRPVQIRLDGDQLVTSPL